jgi:hypothetical protein
MAQQVQNLTDAEVRDLAAATQARIKQENEDYRDFQHAVQPVLTDARRPGDAQRVTPPYSA